MTPGNQNAFRATVLGKRYSVVPTEWGGFALMVNDEAQCFFENSDEAKEHAVSRHFSHIHGWDLAGNATISAKPSNEAFIWHEFYSDPWRGKQ